MRDLPTGVYEELLTEELLRQLQPPVRHREEPVEDPESPQLLADHAARALVSHLADLPPEGRVRRVNEILELINSDHRLVDGPRQLLAVVQHGAADTWSRLATRPRVPLSRPALLTNAGTDPKLGEELRAELATADGVDLLCAFVKWHGLRVLEQQLRGLAERRAPFRVLTTTYMGATDRRALDRLVREFGARVKVNYETRSTRLHAKAWLFRRRSCVDAAYIGSSNLSKAALLDGLEWNVRLAAAHTPELLIKFEATFDGLWEDPSFVPYDPDKDADRLDEALALAGGGGGGASAPLAISGLAVRAYPHQQEILDQLDVERQVHGRHRNLVVAATGTGKTVVAALDYARLPGRPSLLFVAHRKELLEQSMRTYREVLADGNFGELYVGADRPERWRHVFASIQSLTSYGVDRLDPSTFEVVVVDEFHHAEARTYRALLDRLLPRELLGLTATPERSDGIDITCFFGGRAAVELRLWDALEADLLCPFHYFGVSDATDLSALAWSRGDYDTSALTNLYTADDARLRIVLRELRDKVPDVGAVRALGFCVSVAHASFMAEGFRRAGVPAVAVSGQSSVDERRAALQALRDRAVNVVFAVDLFNEGLDVPDVDTLLLLRPTQSATVFLQQLGRGLRRTPDKPVLTVLDFIGQQRREFRFDLKYRAVTGGSRKQLEDQIERGFAFLPSGCELILDAVARDVVLANVRQQLRLNRRELARDLRRHGETSLREWLADGCHDLGDVFRFGSWTALRREAGLPTPPPGPDEEPLLRRTASFAHVDDPERAAAYTRLLTEGVAYRALGEREQRYARMLFFSLWRNGGGFATYQEGFDALARHPAVRAELLEIISEGVARAEHVTRPLEAGLQQATLRTHAHYSLEEVLAALDYCSLERLPSSFREGVLWSEPMATDAFFVTLRKTERTYSPTTMYRDYAVSTELFHWESQNRTSAQSSVGKRYLSQAQLGTHVLLLVRETKTNEWGGTQSYICLGPAAYVSHQGSKPIAIMYRLRHAMPVDFFRRAGLTA